MPSEKILQKRFEKKNLKEFLKTTNLLTKIANKNLIPAEIGFEVELAIAEYRHKQEKAYMQKNEISEDQILELLVENNQEILDNLKGFGIYKKVADKKK